LPGPDMPSSRRRTGIRSGLPSDDVLVAGTVRGQLFWKSVGLVLIPSPEGYAIHKLIAGSRRKEDRDATAKSRKTGLRPGQSLKATIANRQRADIASAFTEACVCTEKSNTGTNVCNPD
jgi:hypothetical protein